MYHVKNGDEIYVYAIKNSGEVMERKAHIISRPRGEQYMLVSFPDGQRMAVTNKAGELYHDVMWSTIKQKNIYIEKITDVLLDRLEEYRRKMTATSKRITMIRDCACGR